MKNDIGFLRINHAGSTIVVGFEVAVVPTDFSVVDYLESLNQLVRESECNKIVFDLSGVTLLSSRMLAVMTSLHNQGLTVSVDNPSTEIRELLEITRLDQILKIAPPNTS